MRVSFSAFYLRRLTATVAATTVMCAAAIGHASDTPASAPVQHRFVASDFWKKKLWHVNQAKPSDNWSADLPGTPMDLQLIGGNRLLISCTGNGYGIFDLGTRKLIEWHNPKTIAGSVSAWRLADGHTMVGVNRATGVVLVGLDATGVAVREWSIPVIRNLRMIRPTPQGTWLLAENDSVAEVTLADGVAADKRIVRRFMLPRPRNSYMGVRLADGRTLVGGGYAAGLFEYGSDGKLTRELVAPQPQGMSNYFYGSVQVLKNSHIAVANWTGHNAQDYRPGWKALEFDPDGKVVWHWFEDAADVGTINNVIILDDLDTNKLNGVGTN